MKILFVINNLDNGGAERLLVNFLPLLKQAGEDVSFLQLSDKNTDPANVTVLEKAGIPVHTLSKKLSLRNPVYIYKISQFLKGSRYDIVHVHLFPSMYWVAVAIYFMAISKRPVLIFTEHSLHNRRIGKRIFQSGERFIYSSYNQVIAVSDQVAKRLLRWVAGRWEKITVIHNGININSIETAEPYSPNDFQTLFAIPPGAFTILMTARFSYPKNHELVISTMHLLPDNFHLLFAGKGEKMEESKALVKHYGLSKRIHFLGYRYDSNRLMKSVDLNLLASEYEGMSTVTIEALASGKPFLGTNVAGINDLVPDKRFLFEPYNTNQLAASILNIAESEDLREIMRSKGKAWAQKFDLSEMLQQHLTLYKKLLVSEKMFKKKQPC